MPTASEKHFSGRHFAVVPAAGQSRRMGCNKLLLPWAGRPLLEHVLAAWIASRVDHVVVVAHPQDRLVQQLCGRMGLVPIVPALAPSDMRESICHALHFLSTRFEPVVEDRWLLAPADLPTLCPELINDVIQAGCDDARIVVPQFGERRGHPVSFPWSFADEVFQLAEGAGVNSLVRNHSHRIIAMSPAEQLNDVDTPEDYRLLCQQLPNKPTSGLRQPSSTKSLGQ